MTANPPYKRRTSSACSIPRPCSTSNSCVSASGSPITISLPWAKFSAPCSPSVQSPSAPLRTASPTTRTVKVAVLRSTVSPDEALQLANGATGIPARRAKLNRNQQVLLNALTEAGGRADTETLRAVDVPSTTLNTLVKRALVEIIEEPAEFHVSRVKARPSPFEFEFNSAQKQALQRMQEAIAARTFSGILLHGVAGSGKTAVYLAAMRTVLEAGRSAIPLVPAIGLTPTVAADLHQVFGNEVAMLHSALSDQERAEQWHRIKRGEA